MMVSMDLIFQLLYYATALALGFFFVGAIYRNFAMLVVSGILSVVFILSMVVLHAKEKK